MPRFLWATLIAASVFGIGTAVSCFSRSPTNQKIHVKRKEAKKAWLGVPFEATPSGPASIMLRLAKLKSGSIVYELGCGDGRLAIAAAKRFAARAVCVDLDPQRIREAKVSARAAGVSSRITFVQGNFFAVDIKDADAVLLFLSTRVNRLLRPRLLARLRPGTRVVSHAFDMGEWRPDRVILHPKARHGKIYHWIVPARVAGLWQWREIMSSGAVRIWNIELKQRFQKLTVVDIRLLVRNAAALANRPGNSLLGQKIKVRVSRITLKGRELQFSVQAIDPNRKKIRQTYRGMIREDSITGFREDSRETDAKVDWTARLLRRDRVRF